MKCSIQSLRLGSRINVVEINQWRECTNFNFSKPTNLLKSNKVCCEDIIMPSDGKVVLQSSCLLTTIICTSENKSRHPVVSTHTPSKHYFSSKPFKISLTDIADLATTTADGILNIKNISRTLKGSLEEKCCMKKLTQPHHSCTFLPPPTQCILELILNF